MNDTPASQRAEIRRPHLFAAAVGVVVAACAALGVGLYELSARRAAAPVVMAVEKNVLADALETAPWISSAGREDDGQDEGGALPHFGRAPVVWLVTAPDCAPCRKIEKQVLPVLAADGVEARVILIAPRQAAPAEAAEVAALSRRRDWAALDGWLKDGRDHTGLRLEPAVAEGYLEWGRASYERIARAVRRNGVDMQTPALFWQDGPEWRASIAPNGRGVGQIKRYITAASWQRSD